jgi:preprotein translocase subunit SecA
LCMDKGKLVHRPFYYAIVDEADSILIDEARIPLVIAGNVEVNMEKIEYYNSIVNMLIDGVDYEIDEHGRNIFLTESGLAKVEEIMRCGNLYDPDNLERLARINCALHAEKLLKKDRDYIVRNGRIEIIDEFTGRIADKRHWPDNLQQAVEAKEGIVDLSKGKILGSITLQHFLNLYPRLSGMTGTGRRSAGELGEFYGLDVVVIPTNKPCIRVDHEDRVFADKESKNKALVEEIIKVNKTGQPILVGTDSVE